MMLRTIWTILLVVTLLGAPAHAQRSSGVSPPDPFILNDSITRANAAGISGGMYVNQQTAGLTPRSQSFNPAQKTLILIVAGQSLCTTMIASLYTPTSPTVIDNFSIYDGASYPPTGTPIGVEYRPTNGQGNVAPNLAQLFITNAIFDRVVYVPICVAGTLASDWASGAVSDRLGVTFRRLASRGYIPGSTGLTFALSWWHGESDNQAGTSQAVYEAAMTTVLANYQSLCSGCRAFINKETWVSGSVSSAVQSAQAALANGTTVFAGGDIDSLNASNRQSDNTHLNDTGRAAAATLVYNAMHASGSPF